MTDLTQYNNKCVHYCRSLTTPHIMAVHTLDDDEECDRIERTWECAECAWADTGSEHVRGYIR